MHATRPWLALLLLLSASLASPHVAAKTSLNASMQGANWSTAEMLSYCQQFDDLYQGIDADLSIWKEEGISRSLMDEAINKYTTKGKNKGIAMGFSQGKAYVVEAELHSSIGHHANIIFTYMQVMMELEVLFGSHIPNVEFVIASSDRPMVKLLSTDQNHTGSSAVKEVGSTAEKEVGSTAEKEVGSTAENTVQQGSTAKYPPVIRFCTSDGHADISAPIFHFYTKKYDQKLLGAVSAINSKHPWQSRTPILFGRFSKYLRHIDPSNTHTLRLGSNGTSICTPDSTHTTSCMVRQHLMSMSLNYTGIMDIRSGPMLPLAEHARYKYLVHVDGQALSSRMEQLMPLGSLIFKEESGYRTFYYHLIKPYKHYIPFWEVTPDNLLERLQWAKLNDAKAKEIAEAAQAFALKYLSKRTRACYWHKLLSQLSKLLRFKTGRDADANRPWVPVREYLETVAAQFENGKWYRPKIETF